MSAARLPAGSGPTARSRLLAASQALNPASERLLFLLMLAMIFFTTLQVVSRVLFTAASWTEKSRRCYRTLGRVTPAAARPSGPRCE
jgi:hypothetical protein